MKCNNHSITVIQQFEKLLEEFESGSQSMNSMIFSRLIFIKRRLVTLLWEDKSHTNSIEVLDNSSSSEDIEDE